MTENDRLEALYDRALELYTDDGAAPVLPTPYGDHLQTIIAHQESNRGVLAVTVTLLLQKLQAPEQDIRRHQAQLEGSFSCRGLDARIVTPFLRDKRFPFMRSGSGWLTRSL